MKLRRTFARVAAASFGLGVLSILDAALLEPTVVKMVKVPVPLDSRHARLAGLRIVHLSDLHIGGIGWRRAASERAIDLANSQDADLVAITGDFIGRRRGIKPLLEILSSLRRDAPRLAVLGNHDHVYGRLPLDNLLKGLDALEFCLLRNDVARVETRLGGIWVGGVDDGYSMRDDLDRVRMGLRNKQGPRLLLTHYPEVADRLSPGEVQLSLAGHTHAGQIRLPLLTRRALHGHARSRYAAGLYLSSGNPLYVSPGVGFSGPPMRFLNLPQVSLLEFVT